MDGEFGIMVVGYKHHWELLELNTVQVLFTIYLINTFYNASLIQLRTIYYVRISISKQMKDDDNKNIIN